MLHDYGRGLRAVNIPLALAGGKAVLEVVDGVAGALADGTL
jgi:hypothetical protein